VTTFPAIPVIDAREGGPPLIARVAEAKMRALLARARGIISPPALVAADHVARRWLARADNPYLAEIDSVAVLLGRPGAYALNTSYEWCCTSAVGPDPKGGCG